MLWSKITCTQLERTQAGWGWGNVSSGGNSVGGTHVCYVVGFGRPPFHLLQNDQNILILLEPAVLLPPSREEGH